MKNLLIIGGGGYIGSQFCKLFSKKYKITVLDPFWFGDFIKSNVKKINSLDGNEYESFLKKNNFDCCLLLAGVSNDPMANLSKMINFNENISSVLNILFQIKESSIKKVIFGSSCSVYGYSEKLLNEKSEIKVQFPYGVSKYLCDESILLLNRISKNTKFYSLRQGTVCGSSPRMRFDLVINKMLRDALFKKRIEVTGSNIWRPILDINDAAKIYDNFICNNISPGIYNIHSYNISLGKLAKKIQIFVEKKTNSKVKIELQNIKELRSYRVSKIKLKKQIPNFKFANLEDTLHDLYKEVSKLQDPFNKKFENIHTFKKIFKL